MVARTVFVDHDYGNNDTGTREDPAHPFQDLQKAWDAAMDGDVIEMRPGHYPVTEYSVLSGKKNVTIHGNGAWIDGAADQERILAISYGADGCIVESLNINAGRTNTGPLSNGAIEFYGGIKGLRFSHCKVINSRSPAWRFADGGSDTTLEDCVTYNCFQGVAISGIPNTGPSGWTIQNCRFYNGTAPLSGGGGLRVSRYGSSTALMDLRGAKIINCQIENAGQMGVEVWAGASGTQGFQNFTVTGNSVLTCYTGISLDCAQAASIDNNRVKGCPGIGIETASGCDGVTVVDNNVDGCDANGTQICANGITCTNVTNRNMIFCHNVVRECYTLVALQNADTVLVDGNQLIKNSPGQVIGIQNGTHYTIRNNSFTGSGATYYLAIDNSNSLGRGMDDTVIEGNQNFGTLQNQSNVTAAWFYFSAYANQGFQRIRVVGNNVPNAASESSLCTFSLQPGSQVSHFFLSANTTAAGTIGEQ